MAPEVVRVMTSVLSEGGANPSSIHHEGQKAARILADARADFATSIGARPAEIVFTSSGTEANNLAISGTIAKAIAANGTATVVTSTVEHASVRMRLDWERRLHGDKLKVVQIGVNEKGLLNYHELDNALKDEVALVALLLVNNETGVVQDLEALKQRKFTKSNVPWLLDVVQAQSKLPMDVRLLPFEMLSFSAHKIYGPKGMGALFVRGGHELDPQLIGGSQEKYRRAGTENLAGIAGFAEAVRIAPSAGEISKKLANLEAALRAGLSSLGIDYIVNGPDEPGPDRLPGFLNLSFPGVSSREDLQIALDLEGVSLSSTSACHSGVVAESHVLEAMGIVGDRRSGAIRLLFSRYHTVEDAQDVSQIIGRVVSRMRDAKVVA